MLTSIVLKLKPVKNGSLSAWLGRANYAATLERLSQIEPGMNDWIHDQVGQQQNGLKPLTCSSLRGCFERTGTQVQVWHDETYSIRITGLHERVSQCALEAFIGQRPERWALDRTAFHVIDAICDPYQDPWSGCTTYEELASQYLLAPSNGKLNKATFEFESPTAFKSGGMQMALPLPGLIFGSLMSRWNAFSHVEVPEEIRDFGEQAVGVGKFDIRSVVVPQKGKGTRAGCIGTASYTALYHDRYWLGLFQLLADFALFSGAGVQTTTGMGQLRRIPEPLGKKICKRGRNREYVRSTMMGIR